MLNGIKEVAYELYKQDWIDTHTTREQRLDDIRNWGETEIENNNVLTTSYAECHEEFGYSGELYVCFEEFLDNEYLDAEYMIELLSLPVLIDTYTEDVKQIMNE